jgi:hypothetical protein
MRIRHLIIRNVSKIRNLHKIKNLGKIRNVGKKTKIQTKKLKLTLNQQIILRIYKKSNNKTHKIRLLNKSNLNNVSNKNRLNLFENKIKQE